MRKSVALAFLLLLAFFSTANASPRNKQLARDAFEAGINHYNLSEFQDALDSFKEAYRQFPDSSFLFNIAQCQRQLGDKQGAIRSYKAFLRETARPQNRAEVETLITALEESVREDERVKSRPPQDPMGSRTTEAMRTETKTEPVKPESAEVKPEPVKTETTIVERPLPPPEKPKHRAWVWGVVGGAAVVVAVGLGVGLGIGLSGPPSVTLGSVRGN